MHAGDRMLNFAQTIYVNLMTSKLLIIACTTLLLAGTACKKKSSTTDPSPANTTGSTTSTQTATGFMWQENSGATITADSAFWTNGGWGAGIRAFKGGYANYFEINWSTPNDASSGTKTINSGAFTFLKGAATYTNPASQTVTVSSISNNQMSGSFDVAVTGGSITSLTGTFTSISKK